VGKQKELKDILNVDQCGIVKYTVLWPVFELPKNDFLNVWVYTVGIVFTNKLFRFVFELPEERFVERGGPFRDAGKGGAGGHRPPCPLVRGAGGGAKVPLDKNSNPKNMRYND
jgi:hypothetical protein